MWEERETLQREEMNNTPELRMKLVCVLLLLGLNSASVSFEMNDTAKSESSNVVEAEAAHKHDNDRAEFMFHSVMVSFIIVGSLFFIAVTLIKAISAPKEKEDKAPVNGGLDVEKHLWI